MLKASNCWVSWLNDPTSSDCLRKQQKIEYIHPTVSSAFKAIPILGQQFLGHPTRWLNDPTLTIQPEPSNCWLNVVSTLDRLARALDRGGFRGPWPPKRQYFLYQTILLRNVSREKDYKGPQKSSFRSTPALRQYQQEYGFSTIAQGFLFQWSHCPSLLNFFKNGIFVLVYYNINVSTYPTFCQVVLYLELCQSRKLCYSRYQILLTVPFASASVRQHQRFRLTDGAGISCKT